jgi:hypothetical protein
MLSWYAHAVREVRQAVDARRINYSEGMAALAELARILGEDSSLRTLWVD